MAADVTGNPALTRGGPGDQSLTPQRTATVPESPMPLNRARLGALAAAFALSLSGTALAAAGADIPPEPGEKWKVTTSMSMMGMSMPGMTTEVCSPKNSDQAPVEPNKDCEITDRRRVGNKETFRMRCTGKQQMEGTMEIEHLGKDHYRGKMLAKMAEGEMTMNYEGQKIPGECDAAEMKRKVAAMQGQAAAASARMCADAAARGEVTMFVGANAVCKDPKDKQAFCAGAQTHKGFAALAARERSYQQMGVADVNGKAMSQSAAACGFKVDAVRTSLCGSAQGKGEWAFLAGECPAIADPLAQRECAGRGFTTPVAAQYRDFCSAYASARSGSGSDAAQAGTAGSPGGAPPAGDQPAQDQQGQKPSAGDAVKGALKNIDKLRGIFGR